MKEKLQQEIKDTFASLQKALLAFNDEQFNKVPFENSWTTGQVTEHIIKSTAGFPQLCQGAKEKAGRPADEKTAGIKKLFLDLSVKMNSPASILPSNGKHDLSESKATLEKIEKDMLETISSRDLSLVVEATEMPGFGKLTVFEWGDFAMTHAQRHTRQIERIFEALKG